MGWTGLVLVALTGCDEKGAEGWPEPDPGAEPGPDTGGDPASCIAVMEVDVGLDGVIEESGRDGYAPSAPDWLVWMERDFDADGVVDFRLDWERDAEGRVLSETETVGGVESTLHRYTYTEEGWLASESYVHDGLPDGASWVTFTYHYDADGNLIASEGDGESDGVVDYSSVRTLGEDGQPVSEVADTDADGDGDVWSAWTYDAVGRQVGLTMDDGNDGTFEVVEDTTYTDPVLRVGTTTRYSADGAGDLAIGFAYDADGVRQYAATDYDLRVDGWTSEEWFTYADGLLVFERAVWDHGLAIETEHVRDDLGREIEALSTSTYGPDTDETLTTWAFGEGCE